MSTKEKEAGRRYFLKGLTMLPLCYLASGLFSESLLISPGRAGEEMSRAVTDFLRLAPPLTVIPQIGDHVLNKSLLQRCRKGDFLGGEIGSWELAPALTENLLASTLKELTENPAGVDSFLRLGVGSSLAKLREHYLGLLGLEKQGVVLVATDCFPAGDPTYYQEARFWLYSGTLAYPAFSFLTGMALENLRRKPATGEASRISRRELLKTGILAALALGGCGVSGGILILSNELNRNLQIYGEDQRIVNKIGCQRFAFDDAVIEGFYELLNKPNAAEFIRHLLEVRNLVMVQNSLVCLNLFKGTKMPQPENYFLFGGTGHSGMVHLLSDSRLLASVEADLKASAGQLVAKMAAWLASRQELQSAELDEWATLSAVYSFPQTSCLPSVIERYPLKEQILPLKSPRLLLYEALLEFWETPEGSRHYQQVLEKMLAQMINLDCHLAWRKDPLARAKAGRDHRREREVVEHWRWGLPRDTSLKKESDFYPFPCLFEAPDLGIRISGVFNDHGIPLLKTISS
jgi:hypothetical protein